MCYRVRHRGSELRVTDTDNDITFPAAQGHRHLCRVGQAAIEVELVRLDGTVENAVELGVADAIADVVEIGESLRGAGLVAFGEPMMDSSHPDQEHPPDSGICQ
jgi:hypothetical protein